MNKEEFLDTTLGRQVYLAVCRAWYAGASGAEIADTIARSVTKATKVLKSEVINHE